MGILWIARIVIHLLTSLGAERACPCGQMYDTSEQWTSSE